MHSGDYCIVVAEDDELLRYCTVNLLRSHGYKIIEARDGEHALELLEKCRDAVHLLITNYEMPGISGVELARKLREKHGRLKVLLISGMARDIDPADDIVFLEKPYNQAILAHTVRELLRDGGSTVTT